MSQRCDHKATSRWTARVIPVILAGVIGYATYVLVKVLIVDYLLRDGPTRSPGAAIAILVVFFLFLLLVVSSYIRILSTIATNPGYIPLGAAAQKRLVEEKQGGRSEDPISREHYSEEYQLENSNPRGGQPPDSSPDSPGLETFYTKDIFVCERDGRPKWCSECANWKPDRTHHCSDIGRCIRKMDHFCPWVGGSVGETNFKFFIQFVSYTCIMCLVIVIVMAYYVKKVEAVESLVQPAVILGLAGFFGLFTGGMAVTSIRFALLNLTTIENLNYKHKVWDLAVAIPPREELERIRPPGSRYPTPTYRTITFPLDFNNNVENLPTSDANLEDLETLRRRQQERLSERDHRATRVFAVLSTEPGEHPWDLGSKLENWKTVMGDNVLDWMLPVRRSPCCDHDDPISHFRLGPAVDLLLAKHGFIGPSEVRTKGTYRPESGKRGYSRSSATEKNVPNGVAQ